MAKDAFMGARMEPAPFGMERETLDPVRFGLELGQHFCLWSLQDGRSAIPPFPWATAPLPKLSLRSLHPLQEGNPASARDRDPGTRCTWDHVLVLQTVDESEHRRVPMAMLQNILD